VALPPEEVGDLGGTVDLDPVTIETFLAVKAGKRTVEEIAAGRGLDETVQALHRLRAMGLVREQPPAAAPLPPEAPPQPPAAADRAAAPPAGGAGRGRWSVRPRSS
jgi:hypothetical protein